MPADSLFDKQTIRILYMEDDKGLATMVKKNLERRGCLVEIAENGEVGLKLLENSSFDAVLVDYDMPKINGLQVIEALTANMDSPPAVMVTGNGSEMIAVEAIRLGAAGYIIKDSHLGFVDLLPMIIQQSIVRWELFKSQRETDNAIREFLEMTGEFFLKIAAGNIVAASRPAIDFFGGLDLLIGKHFVDLAPAEVQDQAARFIADVCEQGSVSGINLELKPADSPVVKAVFGGKKITTNTRTPTALLKFSLSIE